MPLTPITREETFLAKAGGQDVTTPTPITRKETFLQAIIDNGGGGGGTGGGVLKVSVTMEDGFAVMDKTWKEINEATFPVVVVDMGGNGTKWMFITYTEFNDTYNVAAASSISDGGMVTFSEYIFSTNSETGYPVMDMG